jgi:type IV pilus assembly protein PilZ
MTDHKSPLPSRTRRIPVHLAITRSTLGTFLDSEIMNLSKGGVFIRTDLPLPPGSEIDFEFTLPNSNKVVRAEGVVVWSRKRALKSSAYLPDHPPGMGVQFRKLDTSDIEAILDEIESLVEIP